MLRILRSDTFSLGYNMEKRISYNSYAWAVLRQMTLKNVFVNDNNLHLIANLNLTCTANMDIAPNFCCDRDLSDIIALFNKCDNIISLKLKFMNISEAHIFQIKHEQLQKLSYLKLTTSNALSLEAYIYLVYNAGAVSKLHVLSQSNAHLDDRVLEIVLRNKNLSCAKLLYCLDESSSFQLNEDTTGKDIRRNFCDLMLRFTISGGKIVDYLKFTSDSRQIITGFTSNSPPSRRISGVSGEWNYRVDSHGDKFVLFVDSGDFLVDRECMDSILTKYAGFKSIYLTSGVINTNDIETILLTANDNHLSLELISIHLKNKAFISFQSMSQLLACCLKLRRIELINFAHFRGYDYKSLFRIPSSVTYVSLLRCDYETLEIQTIFDILNFAVQINCIEVSWTNSCHNIMMKHFRCICLKLRFEGRQKYLLRFVRPNRSDPVTYKIVRNIQ
jgi:hypothetical protein